jgi:hypothetical protein
MGLSVYKRIISTVKRIEFFSGRMLYLMLRGHWCDIIFLIIHTPTVDKTDDVTYSFYEESEHVFIKFPKYHMKIFLQNSSTKVGSKLCGF